MSVRRLDARWAGGEGGGGSAIAWLSTFVRISPTVDRQEKPTRSYYTRRNLYWLYTDRHFYRKVYINSWEVMTVCQITSMTACERMIKRDIVGFGNRSSHCRTSELFDGNPSIFTDSRLQALKYWYGLLKTKQVRTIYGNVWSVFGNPKVTLRS